MNLSETASRVVPIGEPETPARRLAYNRTFRDGKSLSLLPRLQDAEDALARAQGDPWLKGNRQFLKDTFESLRKILPPLAKAPLPLSADGALLGFPRIFEIATELALCQPRMAFRRNRSSLSWTNTSPFTRSK